MATSPDPWTIVAAAAAGANLVVRPPGGDRPDGTPGTGAGANVAPRAGPGPILTVEDLMRRWRVSKDTIVKLIDEADHPLPWVSLRAQAGRNLTLIRFRLADIEAWELSRVRRKEGPADEPRTPAPAGYSGKVYTRPVKVARGKDGGRSPPSATFGTGAGMSGAARV